MCVTIHRRDCGRKCHLNDNYRTPSSGQSPSRVDYSHLSSHSSPGTPQIWVSKGSALRCSKSMELEPLLGEPPCRDGRPSSGHSPGAADPGDVAYTHLGCTQQGREVAGPKASISGTAWFAGRDRGVFCPAHFPFLACPTGGKKEKEMEAEADGEPGVAAEGFPPCVISASFIRRVANKRCGSVTRAALPLF